MYFLSRQRATELLCTGLVPIRTDAAAQRLLMKADWNASSGRRRLARLFNSISGEFSLHSCSFSCQFSIEPCSDSLTTRTTDDVPTSTRICISGFFNLELADRSSAQSISTIGRGGECQRENAMSALSLRDLTLPS